MQSMPTHPIHMPPPARAVSQPFGWRVNPFAMALAIAVTVVGFLIGVLLVLSLWFMMFGLVILPFTVLAAIGLARHRKPGAVRPSIFVGILGLVELAMFAMLLVFDGSLVESLRVLWPAVIPGAVTVFVAALVEASTPEAVAPPPASQPAFPMPMSATEL